MRDDAGLALLLTGEAAVAQSVDELNAAKADVDVQVANDKAAAARLEQKIGTVPDAPGDYGCAAIGQGYDS